MSRRPIYFDPREAIFYEKTPKHILYSLMRDYALQLIGEDDSSIDTLLIDMPKRIQILKSNKLIRGQE